MQCYLCNQAATSYEHVPAKCFFPAGQRINLITVPSCITHNEKTSKDDEYVRNLIVRTKGNNNVATDYFHDSIIRSFQRSPNIFKLMNKNPKRRNFIKDDDHSKTLTYEYDRERFERVMKKIGYGIYYSTFNQLWNCELFVSTPNLITDQLEPDLISTIIQSKTNFHNRLTYKGSNPEVFKYSFIDLDENKYRILAMKFYDNFEAWVLPKHGTIVSFL